jgi:hypothetical protein
VVVRGTPFTYNHSGLYCSSTFGRLLAVKYCARYPQSVASVHACERTCVLSKYFSYAPACLGNRGYIWLSPVWLGVWNMLFSHGTTPEQLAENATSRY